MKVLVVGCGAVGQVLGLRLQGAGAGVGFYARPATAARLRQALEQGGLPLYQASFRRRREPIAHRLDGYEVVTDVAGAREFGPDQIWFAVPSPVYHSAWCRGFLQEVSSARVVCFAAEGGRAELIPPGAGGRLVFGGAAFMAWQGGPGAGGPQLGAGRPGDVNFWLPPLGIPLAGQPEACRDVARLLKQAGFRVMARGPDSHLQAATTAAMTAFTAGLQLAGWSLAAFRRSPWLPRAARACREAVLGQLPRAGALRRALLGAALLSAGFSAAALLLPHLVPFDLEAYLRFHYRKTRDQTLFLLDLFAADAERRGLAAGPLRAENLRALRRALQDSA